MRNSQRMVPARKKLPVALAVCVVLIVLAGLGVWWHGSKTAANSTGAPPAETNAATGVATNEAATVRPDFQRLVGRWLRPDGGYALEIKSAEAGGRLEVAYFNPGPIHVARGLALRDGTATKVFVELRDVNYPGSTYTLVYEPTSDQLRGIYFQALQSQEFEVAFERMK